MQRILTVNEMRAADKYTIETLGIPEDLLVERAGAAVAEVVADKFKGGRVLIVAGKGNNGADAAVCADELKKRHGFAVTLMRAEEGELKKLYGSYDIIIDGIFGTGLSRNVTGFYAELIDKINAKKAYKISIDIPSGLDGDSGYALGTAVKANLTVAIQEFKTGHFLNDGADYCGEVVAKDIGISIWGEDFIYRLENEDIKNFFPERKRNTHKGTYGKAAIVGGSKEYFGSAMLAGLSLSALKTGAGYAHLCVPDGLFSVYAGKCPECTLGTLKDDNGNFVYDETGLKKLLGYDAISFGMGAGTSREVYRSAEYLVKNFGGRLIIDADGLNSLAKYGVGALKGGKDVVITPHIKEFSRLTGKTVNEILSKPIAAAKDFAKEYGVTVLLKSAASVITDGKAVCINTTGTSALAKCGSGDVLTGILAGIAARGFTGYDSATAAAYLLGKAGEAAAAELGDYSVTATDVINALPRVIKR